jgi:hypothetical protein
MAERTKRLSRRNFLLAVGAGSAATAAALVANPTKSPTPTGQDKRATRGYQDSAHVNNYYRTTKV